jgi:hypothetical protein
VQVSPMMEQIAFQNEAYTGEPAVVIKDPFIAGIADHRLTPISPVPTPVPCKLYALDRTPVVRGALYKYLFVRFHPQTKEIDRVIPAGEITIP